LRNLNSANVDLKDKNEKKRQKKMG
jgi:hypothetical protein